MRCGQRRIGRRLGKRRRRRREIKAWERSELVAMISENCDHNLIFVARVALI